MRVTAWHWTALTVGWLLIIGGGVYFGFVNPPTEVTYKDGCLVVEEMGFTPRIVRVIDCPPGAGNGREDDRG